MASEIIKADNLHLFLLSDSTRIDNNEYLSSLENGTELIVCTEERIQKLLIYFELKRYLSFKNISFPLWSPANFKEELPAPREALINAGWVKNVGEGA